MSSMMNVSTAAAANAADSSLLGVLTLSVDGLAAPKAAAELICPKMRRSFDMYDVPLAQLTSLGMQQMMELGAHIRQQYVEDRALLAPSLRQKGGGRTEFDSYFHASWLDRFAQGAVAMGHGLYPDVDGPEGLFPQPVPVYMQFEKTEHDLAAVRGPCKRTKKNDYKKYAHQRAPDLLWAHRKLLRKVSKHCGIDFTDYSYASGGVDQVGSIIDLAEMLASDRAHGFPMLPGLTDDMFDELQQLAFQAMVERSLSSSRRVTYWLGGFTDVFMNNLRAMQGTEQGAPHKLYSYHAQRELSLALQKLLEWQPPASGNDSVPSALGLNALPPSSTLFFELHATQPPASTEIPVTSKFHVRTYQWTPQDGRQPVQLGICQDLACPWEAVEARFHTHLNKTGLWYDICDYHLVNAPVKKSLLSASLEMAWMNFDMFLYAVVLFVSVGFAVTATVRRIEKLERSRRPQTTPRRLRLARTAL
ncbi:TPA: hypothetical protein N0F65_012618 [Lagenidium giganteum]|uniref:Uncharacterized protein n=1 Tax=Lagenidium giganteum TaxID=4803 RepID=A0AAV2YRR7_9STRA|nr:TPA: hypothetical protein N0F65_012618 [Lagenidium giganteum]